MKDKVFKYEGQLGSVEPDITRGYLYGKLLHINDLITYEAATIPALEKEFQAAVDEYLEDCKDLGVEPNKPFKGGFNVRAGAELHREMVFEAAERGINLNEACIQAFKAYVSVTEPAMIEHVHSHNHTHTYHQESGNFDFDGINADAVNWGIKDFETKLKVVGGTECEY
jgi:predicted HicB family RNase H-like nuclease